MNLQRKNTACAACTQRCRKLPRHSLSTPENGEWSFFIAARSFSSLEDKLLLLNKREFEASNQGSIVLVGSFGHYWKVDLIAAGLGSACQMRLLEYVSLEDLKIVVFFALGASHFMFRVFNFEGSEQSSLNLLGKACSCCSDVGKALNVHCLVEDAQDDALVPVPDEPSCNRPKTPQFSVSLNKSSVKHNYFLTVPVDFTKWIPPKTTEVTVKIKGDKQHEWRLGYTKYNTHGFYRGWVQIVKLNELQEGDLCIFTLVDAVNLVFELEISKQNRRTKQLQLPFKAINANPEPLTVLCQAQENERQETENSQENPEKVEAKKELSSSETVVFKRKIRKRKSKSNSKELKSIMNG